ncbi:hypothetical protein KVT40_003955 [Elsinoe batatas]|uniref:Transcription factor IIIC subunit 5 HTH domain-containing protein n=1 Tax=Elsinoe batatas TaxID=2601811 RepID=A0A8K0PH12_9PEZI|nr:hypothetical protein KVT40_003955 [Elsinoe batatas]
MASRSPSVMSGSDHSESAGRTLTVPHDRIVGIEHPCIIRDIDNAVRALGGEHHMKKVCAWCTASGMQALLNMSSIKTFQPDFSVNASSDYISGPPRFAPYNQPLNYGYGQNRATITTVDDTGRFRSSNINIPRKRHQLAIRVEDAAPSAPPSALPSLTSCTRSLQNAVSTLTTLLRTRQVTTRRAALNLLPDMTEQLFKDATQYVGYAFKSGPWKDCHVLYGVDPRLDPLFRESQILVFQLEGKGKSSATGRYKRPEFRGGRDEGADHHGTKGRREEGRDHVFDGRYLGTNKTFQVRDIEEPIIRALFDVAPVMEECDEHDGWWGNGTMCVARSIMKDMIALIQKGEETGRWKVAYEVAAARMPAVLTEDNVDAAILDVGKLEDEGMTRELARKSVELVHAARAIARQGFKGVGKGRRGRGSTGRFIVGDRRTSTAASSSIGDASADGADMDEDEDMEGQDDEVADGNDGDALADLEAAEFIEE